MTDAATPAPAHERARSVTLFWTVALAPPLAAVTAAAIQPFTDPRLLFIDPVAAAELADLSDPHLGIMSNLGVLMMTCAAAAAGVFALTANAKPNGRCAAAYAAVLSAMIAFDDLAMLHERIAPAHGLSESVVEALYVVAGVAMLLLHRVWMWGRAALLLRAGLFFLGASVVFDLALEAGAHIVPAHIQARLVTPHSITAAIVVEDGVKFIGFWLWTLAHIMTARAVRTSAPDNRPAST